MGIPTPDPDPVFGNDCLECFPPGCTPEMLIVSVTDIKKGGAWNPIFGEPLNGFFELHQSNGCTWGWSQGENSVGLSTNNPGTFFEILGPWGIAHFIAGDNANCVWFFVNEFQTHPGRAFYGGTAQLIAISPSAMPSIASITDLIAMEREPATFFDHYPGKDDEMNISIVRKKDNTHLWIKYEPN